MDAQGSIDGAQNDSAIAFGCKHMVTADAKGYVRTVSAACNECTLRVSPHELFSLFDVPKPHHTSLELRQNGSILSQSPVVCPKQRFHYATVILFEEYISILILYRKRLGLVSAFLCVL